MKSRGELCENKIKKASFNTSFLSVGKYKNTHKSQVGVYVLWVTKSIKIATN